MYLKRLNIHENQCSAGKEIIKHFETGISKHVILVAQMQSGKTGTAKYVVYNLSKPKQSHNSESELKLDDTKFYFICGMNDNDLREQAINEFKGLIPKERILFSKQLQALNHSEKKLTPSLVFVDESHYASESNSQIDLFFKKIGDSEQPYIVSISATPMAEIATSYKYSKSIVRLNPGVGYYGIRDIFSKCLIFPSINITKNMDKFIDLVSTEYEIQQSNNQKKYNIVRLPSQWYFKDIEEEIQELELDIDFINHHSQFSKIDDFNNYLSKKPNKMTIIWVYNSLRAGKQLNTTHIGFVHDTAESKPDTIAQALLGRIMGYNKEKHNVRCYTDIESANSMLEWVNKSFDPCYIPQGSRSIIGGYTDKEIKWKLHPPIMVDLPDNIMPWYLEQKKTHCNRYPYKDEVICDLAEYAIGNDRVTLDKILNTYTPGKHGGLMILTEKNAEQSFVDHWHHNYQCYLKSVPTRGFEAEAEAEAEPYDGENKFYYIFINLNKFSDEFGKALVVYKELINSKTEADYVTVNSKSRYA